MPVSVYFSNYPANKVNEQRLIEDLVVESIKIQGCNVYYLPREVVDTADQLFGENIQSYFSRAYIIDMYPESSDGWTGASEIFNRFGVSSLDNLTLVVAKRTFEKQVPSNIMIRPREGDLIYVPPMRKLFEITFVEEDKMFFTRGTRNPFVYGLSLEAFRTSNEKIETGIDEIDIIDDLTAYTIEITLNGTGHYEKGEKVYQGANLSYSFASGKVVNWDGANNKLYISDVIGSFVSGSNVNGDTSQTSRIFANTNTMGDLAYYDMYDNKIIQDGANTIIDLTEINPLGMP
jgi:hypothetical protein